MSNNNSDSSQNHKMMSTSTTFTHLHNPKTKIYPNYSPNYNNMSNTIQTGQYKPLHVPHSKGGISQSVIFNPSFNKTLTPPSFSKLDTMARLVNTKEDNIPFNFAKNNNQNYPKPLNTFRGAATFSSQIVTQKSQFTPNTLEGQTLSFGPLVAKKRRQSVDLDAINKQGSINPNLNFLKRMNTANYQKINVQKKQECQSTNSGSGNELMEAKKFDFLKKRKQNIDQSSNINKTDYLVPNFQPLKKSDQIWPLSKSPMEQKQVVLGQSNVKVDEQIPININIFQPKLKIQSENAPQNNIQFKKKKFLDNSINNTEKVTIESIKLKNIQENSVLLKHRSHQKFTRQVKISDFQLIQKLGKGAFGQVFMAQEKNLGFLCVIKKMSKKRIKEAKVEEHIIRQIKLQSYLNNKHLTSIYGYFHDTQYIYLILQLLSDGSLQQIKKKKKLPELQSIQILKQVAQGLRYMHEHSVIHRDLKPQNIFMNQNHVKIGDFGCSIYNYEKGLRSTIVGCLQYSSPEQFSKEGYTNKIDSWSLGILAYEMLYGKSPFESQIKKIVQNQQSKPQLSQIIFPSHPVVSQTAKNFILNLLSNNPNSRMEIDEALQHPFLKQKSKN